jgi:hypothetical protein
MLGTGPFTWKSKLGSTWYSADEARLLNDDFPTLMLATG